VAVTDIPWYIHYYFTGTVLSATHTFCNAWVFIDAFVVVSIYILMAWASVERHIIIFYSNLVATKTKRLFLHYLPLVICILWPMIFYLMMLIILPCDIPYFYNEKQCIRYACITTVYWASLLDSIVNYILPSFITVIFSVALFARVIYVRLRIRGRVDWRNYKKMAGQLLPISLLYIMLQLPPMILYAAYSGGLQLTVAAFNYFFESLFFMYWIILLTPFACVVSLPDLKIKCRNLLFWRRRNVVQPVSNETAHRNFGQTVAVVPVAMVPVVQ
jgi:hypothetical protein